METVKETINTETTTTNQLDTLEANNDKLHYLILPYAGPKGKNIIKSMNNNIQQILPNNVKKLLKKKTLRPLFMDRVQLPQG